MTVDELVAKLEELQSSDDPEDAHGSADYLLIEFINNERVTEAFGAIKKWYA